MPAMFEIHSLPVGELYVPHGPGVIRDPVYCWLADNGHERVLVDAGMPDHVEVGRSLHIRATGGGHAALRAALAAIGRTPEDIDFVVPTHLHFDHCANIDLFPKACVVLQRDELLHAVDPVPTQRIYFRRDVLIELINRKRPSGLRLVDGDTQLLEGLKILKLPSHTPGMQVPLVTTERGVAALVSDLGDHYRNWFPADPRATRKPARFLSDTFLPSTIRTAGEQAYIAAMRRVTDNSDIVVPAHDFRIPKHMPQDWFAIPQSTDGDLSNTIPPPSAEGESP